jgi:hypothetical protein
MDLIRTFLPFQLASHQSERQSDDNFNHLSMGDTVAESNVNMGSVEPNSFGGLGSHVYLEKQDKLREIGVDIPTSQVRNNISCVHDCLLTQPRLWW